MDEIRTGTRILTPGPRRERLALSPEEKARLHCLFILIVRGVLTDGDREFTNDQLRQNGRTIQ